MATTTTTMESSYQKINPYNKFLPYADAIDQVIVARDI